MAKLRDELPGLDDFVGVAGSDHQQPGNRPQRRKLLDRLMGRAVLADPDRIMGEHVDDRQLHDRGQTDRYPAIVAEDQEAGTVGPHLDRGHAVENGPHRVLANPEMEVPPAVAAGLEVAGSLEGQPGLGRGGQVRGTADQPGDVLGQGIEDLARRAARGDSLGVRRIRGQALVPAVGKLAMLDPVELMGEFADTLPCTARAGRTRRRAVPCRGGRCPA